MPKSNINKRNQESGFTLIEVLTAVTLFIIVSGAIWGLLRVSKIDRDRTSNRSDMLKNARMAANLIGRDAVNAGLGFTRNGAVVPDNFLEKTLQFPIDGNNEREKITAVIAGNNLFDNDLADTAATKTDSVAFAFRDLDFNNGNKRDLLTSAKQGAGARITLQNYEVNTGSNPFDLYLIETSDNRHIAAMATSIGGKTIDFAEGDPLGLNQQWLDADLPTSTMLQKCRKPTTDPPQNDPNRITDNCSEFPATLKRFHLVNYRVKRDGTLVRLTYGNKSGFAAAQQIEEMPLAYGVENMQIQYVLDDGRVQENPAAGPDGIYPSSDDNLADYNKIRQVTITLTVRSTQLDEQTKKATRITITSTFSTRNMEYDA